MIQKRYRRARTILLSCVALAPAWALACDTISGMYVTKVVTAVLLFLGGLSAAINMDFDAGPAQAEALAEETHRRQCELEAIKALRDGRE